MYVLFPGAGAADVGAVALERRRRLAAARPEASLSAAGALLLASYIELSYFDTPVGSACVARQGMKFSNTQRPLGLIHCMQTRRLRTL